MSSSITHMKRRDGTVYCGADATVTGGCMSPNMCIDCLRWGVAELQDVEEALVGRHEDILQVAQEQSKRLKRWRVPQGGPAWKG